MHAVSKMVEGVKKVTLSTFQAHKGGTWAVRCELISPDGEFHDFGTAPGEPDVDLVITKSGVRGKGAMCVVGQKPQQPEKGKRAKSDEAIKDSDSDSDSDSDLDVEE